jgi:hypothetical protein
MENKIKRPPSVWIAEILILLFLLPFLNGVSSPILRCLISGPSGCASGLVLLRSVLALVGTITISFLTLWGLHKGKKYGRWLAITLLILATAGLINSPPSRMAYSYIFSAGKNNT